MSSLINNYIAKYPILPQQTNTAESHDFLRFKKSSDLRPDDAKGKLLSGSILDIPNELAKDVVYSAKAFKNGINGTANDHQIGKLNDLGMKAGGLALASYLFAQRTSPKTKLMEFIGFASFFASMSLWPKISLQAPALLIHGVNPFKQFEDSQGRKKPFYQDPQYLPWDLYSDKQIEKIGDRLRVDKNIPNRREVIQEKMKKIAVQNNTLWMLTAGIGTPVLSAFMCNALEKPVLKLQEIFKDIKARNMLTNIDKFADKKSFSTQIKDLKNLIEANKDSRFTPQLLDKLADKLGSSLDPKSSKALSRDIERMFGNSDIYLMDDSAKMIYDNFIKSFHDKCPAINCEETFGDHKKFVEFLKENNLFKKPIDQSQSIELQRAIKKFFKKNTANFNPFQKAAIEQILTTVADKAIDYSKGAVLTGQNAESIMKFAKAINQHAAKISVLSDYYSIKAADKAESIIANEWNAFADKFPKILGLSPEEIKMAKVDRTIAADILKTRLEAISTDDTKYKSVVSAISDFLESLEPKLNKEINISLADGKTIKTNEMSLYKKRAESLIMDASNNFEHLGLSSLSSAMADNSVNNKGTLLFMKSNLLEKRVASVKNVFYRQIMLLDTFKRIANSDFTPLDGVVSREVREEIVDLAKKSILSGASSDFSTKLYMKRRLIPSKDSSALEVKNGTLVPKYLNEYQMIEKVIKGKKKLVPLDDKAFILDDFNFYRRVMSMIFNIDVNRANFVSMADIINVDKLPEGLDQYKPKLQHSPIISRFFPGGITHDEIYEIRDRNPEFISNFDDIFRDLNKSTEAGLSPSVREQVLNYRKDFITKVASGYDFTRPRHIFSAVREAVSGDKYSLVSLAPDKMFFDIARKQFNNSTWKKMFLPVGLVTLGVSVVAQFFFGKIKTPKNAEGR